MRENVRNELNQSINIKEREHLKNRIRIIKEHILNRNKKIRDIKVKKIAEQIGSNINNGIKIWEVKRRIKKKRKRIQIKHQTKNEEGETLKQPNEIKKEYTKYYRALLKIKQKKNIRRTISRNKIGETIYRNYERGDQQKKKKQTLKIWWRKR